VSAPFIDTSDPAYDRDIHAAHRAARPHSWYARTPAGILLLTYEDVYAAVRDRRWRELGVDALRMAGIHSGLLWDWSAQIISNQEGERHTRLRRLVSQAFTPCSADRLRPIMRASANALLDAIAGAPECEFVDAFAAPYPVAVIGELLGVPPRDFERFRAWSTDLSLAFSSRIAQERARIESALAGLLDWADRLIAERWRATRSWLRAPPRRCCATSRWALARRVSRPGTSSCTSSRSRPARSRSRRARLPTAIPPRTRIPSVSTSRAAVPSGS
jgi:cytochrome P450